MLGKCLGNLAYNFIIMFLLVQVLWMHKRMFINLTIMPYESTLIDILATIMSLFLCH